MLKRFFDILVSIAALLVLFLPLCLTLVLVWAEDFNSPIYSSWRVGKNKKLFKVFKIRSMTVNASQSGVTATAANDTRITNVGKFIRKWKVDEIPQLINVLIGNMSVVGPRPNVEAETKLYSVEEQPLFLYKPGITDLSSVVFFNEEQLLSRAENPTEAFHLKVRPIKNKIALVANSKGSLLVDARVVVLTIISFYSRSFALSNAYQMLVALTSEADVLQAAKTGGECLFSE